MQADLFESRKYCMIITIVFYYYYYYYYYYYLPNASTILSTSLSVQVTQTLLDNARPKSQEHSYFILIDIN